MSSPEVSSARLSPPLVAILAALVISALAYVLVIMPNQVAEVDEINQALATVPPSEPAVGAESSPAATGEADKAVIADEPSFEVFNARDPFEQLVADVESGAVVGTTDTAATTPTGTTTPAPTTPVGGTDPTGSTTPAPNDGQTTVGTTTIALDDVFAEDGADKVIVVVNGEGYEGAEGETVADVTVLDIEGSCATMRYEDTRFILCEGEHVLK